MVEKYKCDTEYHDKASDVLTYIKDEQRRIWELEEKERRSVAVTPKEAEFEEIVERLRRQHEKRTATEKIHT